MGGRAEHLASTFEAAAKRHPERPAVVAPDGSALTYAELDERADRLAGAFRAAGVQPGDRVGITLPKSFDAVTALLAALKRGAAYVPTDWTEPAVRGRAILSDCAVKALVLDSRCTGVLEGWPGDPPAVFVTGGGEGTPGARPLSEALTGTPLPREAARGTANDLAYVLYTSGSTGAPKGVKVTHGNALSFVDWCSRAFRPTEADRFSSHAPFHFDLSILDLHVAWKHGASVHLIPGDLGRSPRELVRFLVERDLTVWYSTPSTMGLMLRFGAPERAGWPGPRLCLFAGEVFPAKSLRRWTEIWTRPRWFNLYGPTETNVCTFHEVRPPIPESNTEPPPIGKPCGEHTLLSVRNGEGNEAAEPDAQGSLWVAGDCAFPGYWNRPEEDERVFRDVDGRRWYDTGDIVRRRSDGTLSFVGRRDRMVKRLGYRIELGEIEAALHCHPGIARAAVVAVPDEEEGARIVACCVADGKGSSLVEMKRFLGESLPGYMVPDSFSWLEALPLTSTGKTDYVALQGAVAPGAG